jgi:hypothetical protein
MAAMIDLGAQSCLHVSPITVLLRPMQPSGTCEKVPLRDPRCYQSALVLSSSVWGCKIRSSSGSSILTLLLPNRASAEYHSASHVAIYSQT